MTDSPSKTLYVLHSQMTIGQNYLDADSPRMATHHFRKVIELYESLPIDTRKSVVELYEKCKSMVEEWEKVEEASVPKAEKVVDLNEYSAKKKTNAS